LDVHLADINRRKFKRIDCVTWNKYGIDPIEEIGISRVSVAAEERNCTFLIGGRHMKDRDAIIKPVKVYMMP